MRNTRRWRFVPAVAVVVAVTVVGVGGASAAGGAAKGPVPAAATIKFKGGKKDLRLVAPKQIQQGAEVTIENLTNPNKIGPHTFTLVKPKEIPLGKERIKKCEKLISAFCRSVAVDWHQVDFSTRPPTINQRLSDVNLEGWDTPGDRHTIGDSWFTDAKGESFTAPLSSKPRTLHYICIVHPFLRGKIEVTPPTP
jgi:hypothetical protein